MCVVEPAAEDGGGAQGQPAGGRADEGGDPGTPALGAEAVHRRAQGADHCQGTPLRDAAGRCEFMCQGSNLKPSCMKIYNNLLEVDTTSELKI